jgi:hypothetical protein
MVWKAIPVAALALLLLAGAVLAGGPPALERHVVAGGGTHVEADPYVLDATLGQAVVGLGSNAAYELCSGFHCQAVYKTHLPLVLRGQP